MTHDVWRRAYEGSKATVLIRDGESIILYREKKLYYLPHGMNVSQANDVLETLGIPGIKRGWEKVEW